MLTPHSDKEGSMQPNGSSRRSKTGAGPILAVIGAVLVIVSKFLDMGKVSNSGGALHVKGNGTILVAGVILAVIGLAMWVVKSSAVDKLLGVLAILAGAFGALIAGVMIGKEPIISTAATALNRSEEVVKRAIDAGTLTVTVGLGAWLALAGSILVIVAGFANLATARKSRSAGSQSVSVPPPVPTDSVSR
jgi:hypothetical protein